MDLLRRELLAHKERLERAIMEAEKIMEDAPVGSLKMCTCGKHTRHYLITEKGNSTGKYISTKEVDLISRHAKKSYAQKFLREARCELKAIEILLRSMNNHDAETVYTKLNPTRKKLVTPILRDEQERIRFWNGLSYNISTDFPEEKVFQTRRGEMVRSKSELMIADMYFELGIPYRYECEVKLKNGIVKYPDFTLYHAAQRTVYYHEHLGKLDDERYRERNMKKFRLYEQSGILVGKNLLITWESEKFPFNIQTFRGQIKGLFGIR
ncbi:MAG: hypothetical protein J5379_06300 [Clostridiales bacterium]|nr:hypothetical protein [Clostridiales bacterium]